MNSPLYPTIKKFWGLLEYKPQWTLTLKAWLILLILIVVILLFIVTHIHPFLAISKPIQADILVVEGWISDEVIKGVVTEFERGNYQLIITTGTTFSKGALFIDYKNTAELAAATLIALGIDPQKIIAVPSPNVTVNRTAAAAAEVKRWIAQENLPIKRLNLYSFDVHTRRSWLIFKRTFAPEIEVGAMAYPCSYYNPHKWWLYSAGTRSIIAETIAYVYAIFLWRP